MATHGDHHTAINKEPVAGLREKAVVERAAVLIREWPCSHLGGAATPGYARLGRRARQFIDTRHAPRLRWWSHKGI
jgi:hypothetical protein